MRWRELRARLDRVEVRLSTEASGRERREIGAFVRYCVARIEKQFGNLERWVVSVVPERRGGYASHIAASIDSVVLEEHGAGRDGTLAAWDGLERIEQALREHRARSVH
jgi:hypothetical protein